MGSMKYEASQYAVLSHFSNILFSDPDSPVLPPETHLTYFLTLQRQKSMRPI